MQSLKIKSKLYPLTEPLVMGILNLTPDSFFDGGIYMKEKAIMNRVDVMIQEEVDIIDIGGYSTRPEATNIDCTEEKKRILPTIKAIKTDYPNILLSVDTFRSSVAREAIKAGVDIINDISGGTLDSQMFKTVADLKVPYILTHIRDSPQNMQTFSKYDNLLNEMIDFFQKKIDCLRQLNVYDIIIDLGFGFGKNREQNFYMLRHFETFKILDHPILVGLSNKSMIYKTLDISVQNTQNGTTVLNTIALEKGASILRVHDVKAAKETIKLLKYLTNFG